MAPTRNSKRFFDFSSFPNFYAFWCGTSYIIIVRKLTCFYKMYIFFFAFGFDSPTPSQNIRATTWNCEIWKRRNRQNPTPNGEPLWVDHDCMITFPPARWPLTRPSYLKVIRQETTEPRWCGKKSIAAKLMKKSWPLWTRKRRRGHSIRLPSFSFFSLSSRPKNAN